VNPGIGGLPWLTLTVTGSPTFIVGIRHEQFPNAITALGTGSSTFTKSGSTFTDVVSNAPVAVGDFRNVGYPELWSCWRTYQSLLNNGTGIASFGTAFTYGVTPNLIADFNGDGNLDYADFGTNRFMDWRAKGTVPLHGEVSFRFPSARTSGAQSVISITMGCLQSL